MQNLDPLIKVEVHGLRETRKALKKIDRDLPKMLRREMNEAAQGIVKDARGRYSMRYTSQRGRTVNSLRTNSTQSKGRVAFGGARFPYASGQEFGSTTMRQFMPWSGPPPNGGRGSRGFFFYPAIRAGLAEYRAGLIDGVEKVSRRAGFKTRGF